MFQNSPQADPSEHFGFIYSVKKLCYVWALVTTGNQTTSNVCVQISTITKEAPPCGASPQLHFRNSLTEINFRGSGALNGYILPVNKPYLDEVKML